MKYFYIGVLILAVLLSACWLSGRAVTRGTEAVMNPLEAALAASRTGQDLRRDQLTEEARTQWTRREGLLASLLSHSYTNEISRALEELPLTRGRDFDLLTVRILHALHALGEMDLPVLRNIF